MTRVDVGAPAAGHETPRPVEEFYPLPPEAVEEPPRRLGRALRQIGPGLIMAGAIVGTGELISTTHVGAKVGFVLLWLVIVSCFIKVFVQIELGRYAISSGDTTLAGFRQLPGGVGTFVGAWWVLMMLMTQLQMGAMVGGVGQAMHMALPGVSDALANVFPVVARRPELPGAVLAAVATSVLLAIGSYRVVEWGSTVLVVTFTLTTVLCVVLLPLAGHPIHWGAVGGGLTFRLPPEAIAAAAAMFGITGVGATELVSYPYWCLEKGYARKAGRRVAPARVGGPTGIGGAQLNYERDEAAVEDDWLRRARGWMRVLRLDAWVCLLIYTVATLAFYFLGASVLHTPGAGTASAGLPSSIGAMLHRLSEMYAPLMGARAATWFIVVGAFAVLYSTLYSATASNCRVLADFLRVNRLASFRPPRDRLWWVRVFCVTFPLLDLVLYLIIGNPLAMVIVGGIAQALTLPMIAAAAVWLRFRRTDARLAPGRLWDLFLWLSFLGLCGAALVTLLDQIKKIIN